MQVFDTLALIGLVPVIKIDNEKDAVPLCKALADGGLPVAEITFRTEAAERAMRLVNDELPDVLLGAGTVLTVDQVKLARAAGAKFIVSPGFNPKVVGYCVENDIPVLPGCSTPGDIERALEFGLKTVKFFPAEASGGINYIKAISAPYAGVSFVPTGGITNKNLMDYLSFPKVRAVGGSWMAPADAIQAGDFQRIRRLTEETVKTMLGLKLAHLGINDTTPEGGLENARALCAITGLELRDGASAAFAGNEFECMKKPFRGARGHIALGTNNLARARWHIERRGFTFDEASASEKDGKPVAIYLDKEIGGFAVHILQL